MDEHISSKLLSILFKHLPLKKNQLLKHVYKTKLQILNIYDILTYIYTYIYMLDMDN